MTDSYEFVIIGGGSAGYAAARTAHDLGLKTAVIDGAVTLGGLCILRGCMPSKSLIESANRNLTLRRAEEFGLSASNLSVHPEKIRDRKRVLIDDFAGYRQGQLEDGRFDLFRGRASYVDAETLLVKLNDGTETTIKAATSLIASGSVISRPPIVGLEETGYLVSDDVLDAAELPESIIVLGGGAIALEMAHYYEGLGVKTAVIQRSAQVLKSEDEDVAKALEGAFIDRGIDLYTGTALKGVRVEDGKKVVSFEHEGEVKSVAADEILQALGRQPNTGGLELGAAGVNLNGRHVGTDEFQATSAANIFAAGDVAGPHEVVHIAIEQGEAAATNAAIHLGKLDPSKKVAISYELKLFGVFTEPQVASVGLNEKEAKAAGIDVVTADYPFDDHGKSMVLGETHGFVKLLADRATGKLIGGSVVGPHGSELIHEIVVALRYGATAAEFARIPHYHPTLSEIWTYPAEDLMEACEGA
ncbi:MAG: pyruvate/2-oxoglutarate dehydrogenase complex dihydrolipoamide dehydrogenase (E3) component [Pseudoalteromonas tetraodonis]|jgi:pyruvate/2-oxoglutarate dehydrogenase complex dihydrolipoamide dehydrogenase (E3) component